MGGERGAGAAPSSPRFVVALVALGLLAVGVRVLFGVLVAPDLGPATDVAYYREVAAHLADGEGYVESAESAESAGAGASAPADELVPTATHPPAHPVVLAAADRVGLGSVASQRVVLALVSGAGVVLVGLLGRRIGGEAVGLVAAGIGALHPLWIQPAGILAAEATYLPIVVGTLLVADRARRGEGRGWGAALGLGALVGLAALVRIEALLLVGLAGPVALAAPQWRARLRPAALVVLGLVLVAGPWVVRNQVRLDTATLSTNGTATLAGSYCDQTFSGPRQGGFALLCSLGGVGAILGAVPAGDDGRPDPGAVEAEGRDLAHRYARDHADRLPAVALSRTGRVAGVMHPSDALTFDVNEGRHRPTQRVGFVVHWAVLALAAVGVVRLTRRRDLGALALLGVPVLTAVATALVIYGSTRLRTVAEPSLAILAASALVPAGGAILARLRSIRPDPQGYGSRWSGQPKP